MSLYQFCDKKGQLAKITSGCTIRWYPQAKAISIFPLEQPNDVGTHVFTWSGDDKRLTEFIRYAKDFEHFVSILADIYNLESRFQRNDDKVVSFTLT